jgi:uncharacterized membrane protein
MGSIQAATSWHHQGLYMGMHWLWWIFWIAVALIVLWVFLRLGTDERSRRTEQGRREAAEDVLRRRFSEGEIDEDEFLHRMRLIRESRGRAGKTTED